MAKAFLFLICYHLLFFRRFYFQNPYVYARSEALEQGYASSILLGRALRRGRLPDDPYYYPDYTALPFLSTFYPPHMVQAWIGSRLSLDGTWILYSFTMVLHFLLVSFGCFVLLHQTSSFLMSLFGAMTLSSLGYAMKQNSCIVYTLAWVPIFLLSTMSQLILLSGISLGMMLLAGYWPIAIYAIPLGCLLWFFA